MYRRNKLNGEQNVILTIKGERSLSVVQMEGMYETSSYTIQLLQICLVLYLFLNVASVDITAIVLQFGMVAKF